MLASAEEKAKSPPFDRIVRLLRWSQKYMKTDMLYLAKGGFWLTLGQAASMATGLLLVIGFANLLPKDVYGNYKYILSLAGIIGSISLTGMGLAVTQAVARGFEGTLRTGFWVQLKWSVFTMLAASGGATYYFMSGNRVIAISLLIAGACSPIIDSTSLSGDFLSGKKDFKTGTLYGIVRSLIHVTVLLATIALTHDVVLIVLAYFLSQAATGAVLYLRVLKKYKPTQEADRSNMDFGKHVSLVNILSIVGSHFDKILIFHYLGPVQLAVYSIAFSLPAQMKILTKTISSLVFPKMSSVSLETIRSAIYPKTLRIFLAFGAVVAIYILAAPLVFRLIFPQYLDALPYSQALALGYLFSAAVLFPQTFYAQKRPKEIYIAKIVGTGTRILLLLALVPPFGIWGAVYTYILANAVSTAATIVLFHRLKE